MQLLMPPIVASPMGASVEIKPETLNLKGNGVITVFIEFSNSSYDVNDINCSTIKLHVEGVGFVVPIRCFVDDDEFVAKFNGSRVADLILLKLVHMQIPSPKEKHHEPLVVEGKVDGEPFRVIDEIRVMLP